MELRDRVAEPMVAAVDGLGKEGGMGRSAAKVGGKFAATADLSCALKSAISFLIPATTAARGGS